MKPHEDMIGTERMAIKSKNGVKIAIEKILMDGHEQYQIKPSNNVSLKGMKIPDGILLFLSMLLFADGNIYIDAIILGNVGLRKMIVIQNGYMREVIGSYQIEPEEDLLSGEKHLLIKDVDEISIDLNMFREMMKNELIVGTPEELARYGLYYPQIKLYDPNNNDEIEKPEFVIPIDSESENIRRNSFNKILNKIKSKIIRKK